MSWNGHGLCSRASGGEKVFVPLINSWAPPFRCGVRWGKEINENRPCERCRLHARGANSCDEEQLDQTSVGSWLLLLEIAKLETTGHLSAGESGPLGSGHCFKLLSLATQVGLADCWTGLETVCSSQLLRVLVALMLDPGNKASSQGQYDKRCHVNLFHFRVLISHWLVLCWVFRDVFC